MSNNPIHDAIKLIMADHIGRDHRIEGDRLRMELYDVDVYLNDSEMRGEIRLMRKAGYLICSDDKGYYLPASKEEAQEFVARKILPPAKDLLQTARILRQASRNIFSRPKAEQIEMFKE